MDAESIRKNTDILHLIGGATELKKVASSGGGEFAGSCPFAAAVIGSASSRMRLAVAGGIAGGVARTIGTMFLITFNDCIMWILSTL